MILLMGTWIRKVVKILDGIIDLMVFLVCILFFLMGLYGLYDNYMVYQSTEDDSILKYKPGYESDLVQEEKIQGNMVAWLTLYDTNIDYPIMQGETNTEYLNKNPFGDYSLAGSIFLDFRNASEFTDDYSLIYGHHMEGGVMFGELDKYLEKQYFDTHKKGILTVGDIQYLIKIFAVVECEATQEEVFVPVRTDFVLKYIAENALYYDNQVYLEKEKRILGLSTCKYPNTLERIVVFGILS